MQGTPRDGVTKEGRMHRLRASVFIVCLACLPARGSTPQEFWPPVPKGDAEATPSLAPATQPAPQAAPKVHAVFVFDTNGRGIGPFIQRDRWNVLRTFHGGFRDAGQEKRLVWKTLEGQGATPPGVVQAV